MLKDMKVEEFTKVLASDAPAPGGGSSAALAGAQGAALAAMVASLTIGKKKYADYEELNKKALFEAEEIRNRFIVLLDKDTETFGEMSAVFAMPKTTDEEKAARREAMQTALKHCVIPPFEMMETACDALEVTKSLLGKSNMSASSDLGVSALNLKTAVMGAWLNVLINLSSLKDEEFVSQYKNRGQEILDRCVKTADEIYLYTLNNL